MSPEARESLLWHLGRLEDAADQLEALQNRKDWTHETAVFAGHQAASWYSGVERCTEMILLDEGVSLSKSDRWHIELLTRAEVLLAWSPISAELRIALGFRHKFRSLYTPLIEGDRVRDVVSAVLIAHPIVSRSIRVWLDQLKPLDRRRAQENP